MRNRVIGLALIVAAMAVGGQGCGASQTQTTTGPSPTATGLSVSGVASLTTIGQTGQLTASLVFSDHTTIPLTSAQPNGVQWTSSDSSIATVSAAGLVTAAGGIGTVTIAATAQGFTATHPVLVLLTATTLNVTGNAALTDVGQTTQLTATAMLPDGSTRDVTSFVTWTSSDTTVVTVTSSGLVRAVGLGAASLQATYTPCTTPITPGCGIGTRSAFQQVTVTPAGTFIDQGRVRLPGQGSLVGFPVVDTGSGRSVVTNSNGTYNMGALTGSAQLAFNKSGFEPVELVVTGNPGEVVQSDVPVQAVILINAGQTTQATIAPNDTAYDVSPTVHCTNCRLIRVFNPGSGMLHLQVTWNKPSVALTMWIAGQPFPGPAGGPLAADAPVAAGEMVL